MWCYSVLQQTESSKFHELHSLLHTLCNVFLASLRVLWTNMKVQTLDLVPTRRSRRKTEQMSKVLAPIFSVVTTQTFLWQIVSTTGLTVHRLAKFGRVPFADLLHEA